MSSRAVVDRSALGGLLLWCALASSSAEAGDRTRVYGPERAARDVRLQRAVTLDDFHPWTPPADLAAWRLRAREVRRRVLVAAGIWPELPRCDPELTVRGRIERDDYTIEKVLFQSLPGFWVTGNLYRPRGAAGKRPGVLSPHGHWSAGRFYERPEKDARQQIAGGKERFLPAARFPLQARCVHLARMGCIVLHYDMIGYADANRQFSGHRDGFGDVEAELWLQSRFGLQTWDSIRALDVLSALPDVDPARIGVTGASGGGTQTFILGAVDDRPAAAFPAVMVSTSMQGGCVCENASHLRVGTGNIELAALFAPRPLAMTGANDWTREIETKGLPELKALYRLWGVPEKVRANCFPAFEHNYNAVSRRLMYGWFRQHLGLAPDTSIDERDFAPVAPRDLSVFDERHGLPPGSVDPAGVREWLRNAAKEGLGRLVPRKAEGLEELRRVIGGALRTLLATRLPAPDEVRATSISFSPVSEGRLGRFLLSRRAGDRGAAREEIPTVLIRPREFNGRVVVVASPTGKAILERPEEAPSVDLAAVLASGTALAAPDLFLCGEALEAAARARGIDPERAREDPVALFPVDPRRHGTYVGYTYGYNRTLIAQRVHDLLTAVAWAGAQPGVREVRLVGLPGAGAWALLARALAGAGVSRTVAFVDRALGDVRDLRDPDFLPGAARYGDLPYFAALIAPGELALVGPDSIPPVLAAAYRASGAPDRALRVVSGAEGEGRRSLAEWLAR